MSFSDLPQEMLIEIFSRLPAESIGRCRRVAKPWRALLSTPQFLKSHFTRKPHNENLILLTPSGSIHSIATIEDSAAASRHLYLPNNISRVVGSCDGLVLLVDKEQTMLLVNPITREKVNLPDSPLALAKHESFIMHGFGFDRFSNDYKVVTLSRYNHNNLHHQPENVDDIFVDVYSVKRDVWTRVDCFPHDPSFSTGAFVNGAIHWLASRETDFHSMIVAFNFENEVFDEIPGPNYLDVRTFVFNTLVVLGGYLCMIDSENSYRSEIWIMLEYGVADSWRKLSIGPDYVWDIHKPLSCIGNEEIVLLAEEETLFVYNVNERTLSELLVNGVPAVYKDGCAFVQSLVSPADRRMLHLI